MRKLLIAALAALTAIAAVSIANAQTGPGAEVTVSVSPEKVGTKKKPKPTKVNLEIVNSDSTQTADGLTIFQPKQIKVSTDGIKKCKLSNLEAAPDPSSCPAKSKVGSGHADAVAGVNGTSPSSLTFNVTAFVIGDKKIAFLLQQQGGQINTVATGTYKRAGSGYGTKLVVDIPQIAREFPPGTFNGLKGLETSLYKKVGKHSLYKSTGCPSTRTLQFKAVIHFMANPNPPKAEEVTATGGADCHK